MKTLLTLTFALLLTNVSQADTFEIIEDHISTSCSGKINVEIEGTKAQISGQDPQGHDLEISGELASLIIQSEDDTVLYKILLEENRYNFDRAIIRIKDGESLFAFYYTETLSAGGFSTFDCSFEWKALKNASLNTYLFNLIQKTLK